MTSMTVRPLSKPAPGSARPAVGIVVSPWLWMAVTCLLLGISAGIRYWRDWQFSALSARSEVLPFSLNELPRTLRNWQSSENNEAQLDPEVARFAGSVEHVVRSYLDDKTGDQASVLVLYGLAAKVFGHMPDVCYPAAGYHLVKGPIDRTIDVPGVDVPVRYRWAIYMKRADGVSRYEEAYCTFLHNGEWLPDFSSRWKTFRYHPGMFKVQIAHPISALTEDSDGPCLGLLGELAREVTARAYPSKSGQAAASAPSTSTAAPAEKPPG